MQKVNFWVVTFSVTVNVNNQITTEVTCIRLHIARKLVFLLPVASCSSEKTFKHWLHGSINYGLKGLIHVLKTRELRNFVATRWNLNPTIFSFP